MDGVCVTGIEQQVLTNHGRALKRLQKDIAERWKATVTDVDALHGVLDGLNMDVTQIGAIQGSSRIMSSGDIESYEIKEMVHGIACWTLLIASLYAVVLGPVIGIIVAVKKWLSGPDGGIRSGLGEIIKSKVKSSITPKLRQPLANAFCDRNNREQILPELNAKVLRHILDRILENCQNALADQRKRFEENAKRLLAAY